MSVTVRETGTARSSDFEYEVTFEKNGITYKVSHGIRTKITQVSYLVIPPVSAEVDYNLLAEHIFSLAGVVADDELFSDLAERLRYTVPPFFAF